MMNVYTLLALLFLGCLSSAIGKHFKGYNGISYCYMGFTTGDNDGGKEAFVPSSDYTEQSCFETCKKLYPESVGLTESLHQKYSSGNGANKNKCWCEFGNARLNGANINYHTCMFETPDALALTKSNPVCPIDEFACPSGECIPLEYRCDGEDDCDDNSDETNCVCSPTQFSCQSGQCIPLEYRCNGMDDCMDNSDEDDCKDYDCLYNQFSCLSGTQCIPQNHRCDGAYSCSDGSDEDNCKNYSCPSEQFSCMSGQCISQKYRCDGRYDCNDGSDEEGCKDHVCSSDEFGCRSGQCIPQDLRCDGYKNCHDDSDEDECKDE